MKSSTWILVIIIVLVLSLAWVGTNVPNKETPSGNTGVETKATKSASESSKIEVQTINTKGNMITIVAPDQIIINYSDVFGFQPNKVTIQKGQTVTWKNSSETPMWVASAMHPSHATYPTTGGCLGSTFDACKTINKGESWSFQFDFSGEWKYHNHRKPTDFGTVVVQ
ncbi:MAG: hypothetical protein HZA94_01560 [Candidatus Vogelbacteria bacterium]|nr:hypothetical protein [Candidatus Vogelbacteria bacterium]